MLIWLCFSYGWTECLPLLTKSAKAVVSAFQQARACFPFPILGLDTDNGSEFINECLLAYCEAEQITFTRGREGIKNDQCFIEQKNGAVVRQVIMIASKGQMPTGNFFKKRVHVSHCLIP